MKKRITKVISLLLSVLMLLCIMAGCSSGGGDVTASQDSQAPAGAGSGSADTNTADTGTADTNTADTRTVTGSVLNVIATEDMPCLTPMANMCQPGFTISFNVFQGLTQANNGDWNDVVPCLAASWDISEDGLEYTFTLRQGVKFHDGSDFDASDVIATFDYLKVEQPSLFASIAGYESADPYTFVVHMSAPHPTFIAMLGSFWFLIVSGDAIAEYGYESTSAAVGTGRFAIDSYNSGEKVVLKAFKDYWESSEVPCIETVNFNIITDSTTAFLALQNGEVDFMPAASATNYQAALTDSNLEAYAFIDPSNWIIGINSNVEPFDKLEVRQAIDCFIDKEQINMAGYDGLAKATDSTYAETSALYVTYDHEYNAEKGLELLDSVGLKPSDLSFVLKCSSISSEKAMAENIQAQLLSAGMKVELEVLDVGPLNETRVTMDFTMNIYDTGASIYNPLNSLDQMFNSGGVVCTSGFKNTLPELQAEVDALIAQAVTSATIEDANKYALQAVELYQGMIPFIPVIQRDSYHIYNANLTGVYCESSGGFPFFHNATWKS